MQISLENIELLPTQLQQKLSEQLDFLAYREALPLEKYIGLSSWEKYNALSQFVQNEINTYLSFLLQRYPFEEDETDEELASFLDERLKKMDEHPDQNLSVDQLHQNMINKYGIKALPHSR
jgi:CHAD domain-containing protein